MIYCCIKINQVNGFKFWEKLYIKHKCIKYGKIMIYEYFNLI